MEGRKEGIRTMIGRNFNARIGEMGGRVRLQGGDKKR